MIKVLRGGTVFDESNVHVADEQNTIIKILFKPHNKRIISFGADTGFTLCKDCVIST